MTLNLILSQKGLSKYRLAKESGIPYTTINDICSGKANLAECSAKTIYKLSNALKISMEELLEPYMRPRPSFEIFKSNVCHNLHALGDIDFLINTIENDEILTYYNLNWFPECLYLLAMVDYISRINGIPLCENYNDLRHYKLKQIIYPASVITAFAVSNDTSVIEQAVNASIPEFIKFNIVESEVRNVI